MEVILYNLLFKMSFIIVEGHRGCANLLLDGFQYLKTSTNKNGSIRWRCTTRGCKSLIVIKDDTILKHCLNHQHEASKGQNVAVLLVNNMRKLKCLRVNFIV